MFAPLSLPRWFLRGGLAVLAAGLTPLHADPDDIPGAASEPFSSTGLITGTLRPGLDEIIRFGVIGDYGTSGVSLAGISGMMRGWDPAFIVSTGDNTYGALNTNLDRDATLPGMQNDWEFNIGAYFGSFLMAREDGKFPLQVATAQRFFPTVGNHDSAPDASSGGTIDDYLDYFHVNPGGSPRLPVDRGAVHTREVSYYAVRRGPVDLFVLDGDVPNRPDLIAAQKTWLTSQLASSTARWKLAVFHQPPLTSGFRAAAAWMSWDELKSVDAIFCGHDHFYERLDYFGTPLFITGAGGQSLYSFRSPPDARSLYRYNLNHSALLLTADASSLRIESRAFEQPARQESLIEVTTLGTPVQVDNEDACTFFCEAGETVQLRTSTLPPLSSPPLTPWLTLFTPGGPAVTPDQLSSPDGRNLLLTHGTTLTGIWTVKIGGTIPGAGAYALQLTTTSPHPDFPVWSASLPAGQRGLTDDPDGDGWNNLMEYALQTPATAPGNPASGAWQGLRVAVEPAPDGEAAEASVTLVFDLPSPLPPGVSYQIEAAEDPSVPWQVIAWRPPGSDWQALPGLTIGSGSPLPGARRTALTVPATSSHRFFRLTVCRNG